MSEEIIIKDCKHASFTDWGIYACTLYNPSDNNCIVQYGTCAANKYCPHKKALSIEQENQRLREALEKISNGNRITYCRSREALLFGCANKDALNINCQSCDYFIAKQALGE